MSASPVAVEIIRRRPTAKSLVAKFIEGVALHAIRAWVVMLILGGFTPWHLGYWQVVVLLIGVDYVRLDLGHYKSWTTEVAR